MMRTVAVFALLSLASADFLNHPTTACAINGARAVNDLLDAATYIWASVKRCQQPGHSVNPASHGNKILCAMDVSASIESVNAMMNVILKGVEECGELNGANHKCGMAVGVLTEAFAGMSASAAGITAKCPNPLNGGHGLTFLVAQPGVGVGQNALASAAQSASFGQCLVDVTDLTKSLFKATKRIMTVKENCAEGKSHCADNSLRIVAAFSAMGEYLAGAVGRCSAHTVANAKLREQGQCAEQSVALIRHITNVGTASVAMHKACHMGALRLYELENGVEVQGASSNTVTISLAALLPLTAVLSFVGGSRMAKNRGQVVDIDEGM